MAGAYHKPVITVWDDEALAGIEAKMSYGGGGSSSGGGGGIFTTPEIGSLQNPMVLAMGVPAALSRVQSWFKFTAPGATDFDVAASGPAGIRVYSLFNGAPTQSPSHHSDDVLRGTIVLSSESTYYLEVLSRNGVAVSASALVDGHLDRRSGDYDVGAVWKPDNPNLYIHNVEKPYEVIYLPGGSVEVIVKLVQDDVGLQLLSNIYDGISIFFGEIKEAATMIEAAVSTLAQVLSVLDSVCEPKTTQQLIRELSDNADAYSQGIRAYHFEYSLSIGWQFEPWDSASPMRGVYGSCGSFTRNESHYEE